MQKSVLSALEFDRVCHALADTTLTALGRGRASTLLPAVEADDVRARLALTSEAVAFVRQGGTLALAAPEDLDSILAALGIADQPLDPLQLLGLARLLESVATTTAAIASSALPSAASESRERSIAISRLAAVA